MGGFPQFITISQGGGGFITILQYIFVLRNKWNAFNLKKLTISHTSPEYGTKRKEKQLLLRGYKKGITSS